MKLATLSALFLTLAAPELAPAEEIRIALWNCETKFDVATVGMRATDLQAGEGQPARDCQCQPRPRLSDGRHAELVDGLHMASLTKGIGGETYDDPQFAGSGPIDCLYVIGRQASDFTLARKTPETFGSDHFAVSTRFLFSGTAPTPEPVGGGTGSASGSVRISALLPDPPGADGGHEWVKLKNNGADAVDLGGWTLQDAANHTVTLSGTIAAGAERQIQLADSQMPLNQGGDEITLRNPAGDAVDSAGYTAGQVSPGVPITFEP
jgi:hypothetical protein